MLNLFDNLILDRYQNLSGKNLIEMALEEKRAQLLFFLIFERKIHIKCMLDFLKQYLSHLSVNQIKTLVLYPEFNNTTYLLLILQKFSSTNPKLIHEIIDEKLLQFIPFYGHITIIYIIRFPKLFDLCFPPDSEKTFYEMNKVIKWLDRNAEFTWNARDKIYKIVQSDIFVKNVIENRFISPDLIKIFLKHEIYLFFNTFNNILQFNKYSDKDLLEMIELSINEKWYIDRNVFMNMCMNLSHDAIHPFPLDKFSILLKQEDCPKIGYLVQKLNNPLIANYLLDHIHECELLCTNLNFLEKLFKLCNSWKRIDHQTLYRTLFPFREVEPKQNQLNKILEQFEGWRPHFDHFCETWTCKMCLDDALPADVKLDCSHYFHRKCVEEWVYQTPGVLVEHNRIRCGMCREPFRLLNLPITKDKKIFVDWKQILYQETNFPGTKCGVCKKCHCLFPVFADDVCVASDAEIRAIEKYCASCTKPSKTFACPGCGMQLQHLRGCNHFACCYYGWGVCNGRGARCDHGKSELKTDNVVFCGRQFTILDSQRNESSSDDD